MINRNSSWKSVLNSVHCVPALAAVHPLRTPPRVVNRWQPLKVQWVEVHLLVQQVSAAVTAQLLQHVSAVPVMRCPVLLLLLHTAQPACTHEHTGEEQCVVTHEH